MTALVCGSYAFDQIMVFHDHFKNHILPDKVHMLNVSFLVPQMRREFGGTAGNIVYNLKLLGGEGLPMATVGVDFAPYRQWIEQCGISTQYLKEIGDSYTAQAFITTDLDDNQITAFHPGAMGMSHEVKVSDAKAENISLGMVSPDGKQGMIEHAAQFVEAGIPFFFDPGQGLPMFDKDELLTFIDQATWITVNDYESELMQERTGLSAEAIAEKVDAFIVTRGGEGSLIYTDGKKIEIPVVKVADEDAVDPTGCGDAFRAGLLYGLMNDMGWEKTGRIASLVGSVKIGTHGTQNHQFDAATFAERFQQEFGEAL